MTSEYLLERWERKRSGEVYVLLREMALERLW